MQNIILERFAYLPTCTLGRVFLPNGQFVYSLELPWRDNMRSKSCIPEGAYECDPYSSKKFPDVYEVKNVPGRSSILIHTANQPKEIEGCIAPGLNLMSNYNGVLASRAAMEKIRLLLNYASFRLLVTHYVPEYP